MANSTIGVATGPTLLAPHPQSSTDNTSVRIMLTEQGEGEGDDGVGELGQMRVLEKPNRLRQESEIKRLRMMRGATTSPSMAGSMAGGATEVIPPHKPGKSVPTTSYNSPKDTLLACIKAGLAKSILPVRTQHAHVSARTFRTDLTASSLTSWRNSVKISADKFKRQRPAAGRRWRHGVTWFFLSLTVLFFICLSV